jgi:DNA-binding IclR family transcriptional regulator
VLNGMGLSDHSTYDIGRILEAAGLTASSASSVASALAREGKLERQGRGTYRKAGNYDPPASGLAA